ncbi:MULTISPECIES: hypothetical protein [Mycobacterium]|uniref:hypothetical protein n=1 Tax=Mycobacterium TaxID=1763 RepID=UPI001041EC39|nr:MULTISPECIES: hypothetical protein [Mycobacterium]MCG7607725.1 hypothetical protein [Mycobacterium sp. CnD-18-1]
MRGNRWLWTVAAVVAIAGATAGGVWTFQQRDVSAAPPAEECAVVERLGHEWLAMTSSVNNELSTGPGGRDALLAAAQREAIMGSKIRSEAQSVSTMSLKDELTKWAEAAELGSQVQRDSANRDPRLAPSAAEGSAFIESSVKTYEATAALREQCPDMPAQPKTEP